jgi:hypothetical protein
MHSKGRSSLNGSKPKEQTVREHQEGCDEATVQANVIQNLRILAADADEQLTKFPADAPRHAHGEALTFDPDFDAHSYLLNWGLIDEAQELSLADVREVSLDISSDLETVEAMRNDPSWLVPPHVGRSASTAHRQTTRPAGVNSDDVCGGRHPAQIVSTVIEHVF